MKKLLCLTTLCALSVFAGAQVNTTPVGFYTVAVPAGTQASPSFTTVSFPLSSAVEAAGTITSVDGPTQFSVGGAAWTPGAFVSTTSPRLARVTSGTEEGRFFLITANTSNQLTVDLSSAPTITDLTTVLAAGNTVQIVPAFTLGGLFGTSTTPLLTGAVGSADNIWILSGQSWFTYFHNGTNWRRSGSTANQNNTIIYPDEGLLIVRRGETPVSLTFTGAVPTVNVKTDVVGSGSTFLANQFPVDTQLNSLGLQNLPGWLKGTNVSSADNVWIWNPAKVPAAGWDTHYFHSGAGNWRRSGATVNTNATVIPAGSAVIIIKNGAAANSTLSMSKPYSL